MFADKKNDNFSYKYNYWIFYIFEEEPLNFAEEEYSLTKLEFNLKLKIFRVKEQGRESRGILAIGVYLF